VRHQKIKTSPSGDKFARPFSAAPWLRHGGAYAAEGRSCVAPGGGLLQGRNDVYPRDGKAAVVTQRSCAVCDVPHR
jgi:hypothetical protein